MSGFSHLGLDIGGQGIKGIRIEADGVVSARLAMPTSAARGSAAVLDTVSAVLATLLESGPAASLGAGTPGAVDASGRVAGEAANIPGWLGTALRDSLEKVAGIACVVRNDGNTAAYGEWAAREIEPRALLFVGLGTGIGGGYVEGGRLLGGLDDMALELGHLIVEPGGRECGCGRSGCVEAYASGPAIGRMAAELALSRVGPLASAIRARQASGAGATGAREVYEAYAEGDPLAREVHALAAMALAKALGSALALLAPEVVVFGGGVMEGAGDLVRDVAALVPRYVYDAAHRQVRWEKALLGPDAGLVGAALLGASSLMGARELRALAAAVAAGARRPG